MASSAVGSFLGGLGGGAIGSAVVKLYLDNGQYQAALAKSEAQLGTAAGGMSSKLSAFKVVGAAAFAAVGLAAIRYAGDAVAAAREHEVAVVELQGAVAGSTEALESQASALQKVTGYSDEAILSADTILSRFNLTTDVLGELNPLLLDYARATGQDAAAAASGLGKALLGNTRALKSVGIEFTATGNRAKDVATLMELLRGKVAGVAEEFGKTSEGQALILQQRFEEVKETIGMGLLPVVDAAKEAFIAIAPVFEKVASVLKFVFVGIAGAIYLVEDAFAGLATIADHVLGPLYDFDGSMSHLSDHAAELQNILDGNVGGGSVTDALTSMATKAKTASRAFRKDLVDAFQISGEQALGFKAKFDGTVHSFTNGLRNMRNRLKTLNQDFKEFNSLDIGKKVRDFLLQQGPEAIHSFVEANRKSRDDQVGYIKDIISQQAELDTKVSASANKVKGLRDKIVEVGKEKAVAEVIVNYSWSGEDPRTLPGLGAHP